jgi:hypothetical protein
VVGLDNYDTGRRENVDAVLRAAVFGRAYGLGLIGLRYFNVFGPRQDPDGPYAAVMPCWFAALLCGGKIFIDGDGETSRDFRPGDVRHSLTDVSQAAPLLGYEPTRGKRRARGGGGVVRGLARAVGLAPGSYAQASRYARKAYPDCSCGPQALSYSGFDRGA